MSGVEFQIDPFTAVALVGGWMYVIWLKITEWRRKSILSKKSFDRSLIMGGEIYKINNQILKKYKCLRVFLCQFSNGIYYASGQSKQNLTITHECVADDDLVKKMSNTYNNQPLGKLDHDILMEVSLYGQKSEMVYSAIPQGSLKTELDTFDAKTFIYLRVTDKKGNSIATLCLHWNFDNPIGEFEVAELKHFVMQLENTFAKYD